MSFPVGPRLHLFTGMLGGPFTSSRLSKLFALLRAGIVRITGSPKCALNAPVYAARSDDGFPLHADDLFLTNHLWLIFDNVPKGEPGASLFLPTKSLAQIVGAMTEMPRSIRSRLRNLLECRVERDSFDELYGLLYSQDNPWAKENLRCLRRSQWRIKLNRGEGYLLDDHRWLHGREALSGAVSASRFRRLVFGRLQSI